jgi:hypothetical protein
LVGARAERRVGAELAKLDASSWLVIHGLPHDWGGDIDHIACGPTGIYIIETKSYRFRRVDLVQAARNAAWLKQRLGVRWVTGILCVSDATAPRQEGAVWVMGREHLLPWLQSQRNTTTSLTCMRRLLLGATRDHTAAQTN